VPELPEVEVLVRHLRPLLLNQTVSSVEVRRNRVLRPTSPRTLEAMLPGARIRNLTRRGKYLLFEIQARGERGCRILLGHLGMTGRMYVLPAEANLPKHAAVILGLGRKKFVFEDTRYFGRLTLDISPLRDLGLEPLSDEFTVEGFAAGLLRSAQPIKVKLLDQTLVAGVGNIYASEALFRAGISPRMAARRLNGTAVERLWRSIRKTLGEAIKFGSTVPLNFRGVGQQDGLFYYGRAVDTSRYYEERLRVYDRQGEPCLRCGSKIKRIVQAARSTFYCSKCQPSRGFRPR
jgi:formamidopyrimidine-DNA glycosylase